MSSAVPVLINELRILEGSDDNTVTTSNCCSSQALDVSVLSDDDPDILDQGGNLLT